jgi:hypothetical protein
VALTAGGHKQGGAGGDLVLDANGRVPSGVTQVVKEYINPTDTKYGYDGLGGDNDYNAWKSAHDDLATATKGHLLIPPLQRVVLNPSTPKLPILLAPSTDIAKRSTIEFAGDSHVVLSANYPHVYAPGRSADGQQILNVDFLNPGCDGNAITPGSGEDIWFGPTVAGGQGTYGQRMNYKGIRTKDPRFWNAPAGGSAIPRRWLNFLCRHIFTNEGDAFWNPSGKVQGFVQDISLEGFIRIEGGDMGFIAIGSLQRGSTSGMRIKNFAGSPAVINYVGLTGSPPPINDYIAIGSGAFCERHRIIAIADNGDGTGSITLEGTLTYAQPQDDTTGAGLGAPMCSGNMANVWVNGIHVDGHGYIRPGTGAYGSVIQVGGGGIGGYDNSISDGLELGNSLDNTIEIDTVLGSRVGRVRCVDPGNEGVLHRNFNFPQDKANNLMPASAQRHKCEAIVDVFGSNPSDAAPAAGFLPGYVWTPGNTTPGAAPQFGTVEYDAVVIDRAANFRVTKGSALWAGNECAFQRIEGKITYIKTAANDNAAGSVPRVFNIAPSCSARVKMRLIARLIGSMTNGAVIRPLDIEPWNQAGAPAVSTLNVDGTVLEIESRLSGASNSGSHRLIELYGHNTVSANKGNLKGSIGIIILDWAAADGIPKVFCWGAASAPLITNFFVIDGCDLSSLPNSVIHTLTNLGTYNQKIKHTGKNRLIGTYASAGSVTSFLSTTRGFQPVALTPAASPWTWINDSMVDVRFNLLSGWTISQIDYSDDSGSNFSTTAFPAVGNQSILLRPGDALKVTYSVAGTAKIVPILP